MKVERHLFLAAALDEGEQSTARPGRSTLVPTEQQAV